MFNLMLIILHQLTNFWLYKAIGPSARKCSKFLLTDKILTILTNFPTALCIIPPVCVCVCVHREHSVADGFRALPPGGAAHRCRHSNHCQLVRKLHSRPHLPLHFGQYLKIWAPETPNFCDLHYFCRNTSIRMGPVCLWWRVVHCGSICIDIFLKLKDWVWSRSPQGWGGASGLSILSPFTCVWISPFYVRILCDRCGGYACAVGAARIKRRTYAAAENVAGRTEREWEAYGVYISVPSFYWRWVDKADQRPAIARVRWSIYNVVYVNVATYSYY